MYGTMIFIWLRWCHKVAYWFDHDDATRCLTDLIMVYIYIYMTMRWHEIKVLRFWLRSTTGSYGQTCVEVAYGEIMIHSIEAIMGDASSGRVVAVSPWDITHGRHIRVNTNVGTIYYIFWFSWYKDLYIYVYYF